LKPTKRSGSFFPNKGSAEGPKQPMTTKRPLLLIPVENQVRELDPKLLLACVAAERGFPSVIGSRREMEFGIDLFPQSIYLSKSMTIRSLLFFRVAKKFGHEIITWDEEALVHLPSETYFSRRLDPNSVRHVSHLFAWGRDNAELWRQYTDLPDNLPIHITGNPRSDMLRPELQHFYTDEVKQLRRKYGDFILINTNFNHINAFGPDMNLFKPLKQSGKKPSFGRAARGMNREYAEGLQDHKLAVFEDFKRLIPNLEKAFPDYNIVVRPHPTENQEVYRRIASGCQRVRVTNAGNVVPWLMASKALIHNGCTTGVEAYVMRVPALSYQATVNDAYDYGFYILPNKISHQCFDFEQLKRLLQRILAGEIGAADGNERRALIEHHLAAQEGPLACERMVDVLETISENFNRSIQSSLINQLERRALTLGLHLAKRIKSSLPGSHNRPEFQRHRYPGISLEALHDKLLLLQRLLGIKTKLKIEQISNVMFQINP
jgi:surface carbohydrate biosynthesis protein